MEPAGVATSTPSAISSASRSWPSIRMRRCAACAVWRNSETSLMARCSCVRPCASRARITSGWMTVICAAASRSARPVLDEFVHQEADGAAVHAVDRLAGFHELVQGLQHQAVAAERDDHVGFRGVGIAVALFEPRVGLARLRRRAGDEGDMLETLALSWLIEGPDDGTRGARLYDLALDCRGGAGRARQSSSGGSRPASISCREWSRTTGGRAKSSGPRRW